MNISSIKNLILELLFHGFIVSEHTLYYLLGAIILLGVGLFLSLAIFHKKIKSITEWIFYSLPSFCFLVLGVWIYAIFLPLNNWGALVISGLLLLSGGVYFILTKGYRFAFKKVFNHAGRRTLLKYLLVFLGLAVFYGFDMFQNKLPYSAGSANIDVVAHNEMILEAQRHSLLENMNPEVLFYPKGVHATIAYFDQVTPGKIYTPAEFIMPIMAFLGVGIIAYFRKKRANIWELLPFLIIPSFTMMAMYDHINSAAALIPLFLIYVFFIEKILISITRIKAKEWSYLIMLAISFYALYNFSLLLSCLPLGIFGLTSLLSEKEVRTAMKKHWFWTIIIGVGLLIIATGTICFMKDIFKMVYDSAILQQSVDQTRVTIASFLGLVNYPYNFIKADLEIPLLQIIIGMFWLVLLLGRLINWPKENATQKLYYLVVFLSIFFLLGIRFLIPSSYIFVRCHSYLIVLLMVFLANTKSKWSSKNWYKYLVIGLSILSSLAFGKMLLENQIRFRRDHTYATKLDLSDAEEIRSIIPQDSKVLAVHFSNMTRTFRFLLYDDYQLTHTHHTRDFSGFQLSEFDYLIARYVEYNDNYPSEILEKVYERADKDYVIFKVREEMSNLTLPTDYSYYLNQEIVDEIAWSENFVLAGYRKDEEACKYYGPGEEFEEFASNRITQDEIGEFKIDYLIVFDIDVWDVSSDYHECMKITQDSYQ